MDACNHIWVDACQWKCARECLAELVGHVLFTLVDFVRSRTVVTQNVVFERQSAVVFKRFVASVDELQRTVA